MSYSSYWSQRGDRWERADTLRNHDNAAVSSHFREGVWQCMKHGGKQFMCVRAIWQSLLTPWLSGWALQAANSRGELWWAHSCPTGRKEAADSRLTAPRPQVLLRCSFSSWLLWEHTSNHRRHTKTCSEMIRITCNKQRPLNRRDVFFFYCFLLLLLI